MNAAALSNAGAPAVKHMIYHVPYPLDPNAKGASGIRPVQMRRAFESIGYSVTEIAGVAAERKKQIRAAKQLIRQGVKFEFVYSEASTKPTAMTEKHSLPTHPFLDLNFLAFCRKKGIPVGLFYRDIYWISDMYLESVPRVVAFFTRALYRYDLLRYKQATTKIFLPSMRMAAEMPYTSADRCVALPPASPVRESPVPEFAGAKERMSLFYVGALGSYYRMHAAVEGVEASSNAKLTLCTREDNWASVRDEYESIIGDRIQIVHRSGAELEPMYAESNIGMLFMEPIGYREFAAPMKLYEYLSYGKPIIATEGSLAGDFVRENAIGWVLPYTAEALTELLQDLQEHPGMYDEVRANVLKVRESHTWEARAAQAAEALR
ncbi:glycosyltransferase [Leucobacter sp. cx-42]|uniref:glycosyltransferase n=1 Tax=unclassified Leucobacter TaxID=2621730 RepID=UPI00165D6A06|nr:MULTISPECIES: glycosyltransferase [unclassified Leucobacter]MBC9953641.1 glycosyltransferase [Leucobacter sp. cx-42]